MTRLLPLFAPLALLACTSGGRGDGTTPGDQSDQRPYSGIAETDVVRFVGTEPFWGGDVRGGVLTWTTPDDQQGQKVQVARFAGRGGLSFTGKLSAQDFAMTLTEATCSDGMSDRTYPFVVTVAIGDEPPLSGCGWTDRQPHSGGEG